MKGKVKWFSEDKGYGFITGEDNIDRYFSVRNVVGADLPKTGDRVAFEHVEHKKGARASGVTIIYAPQRNHAADRKYHLRQFVFSFIILSSVIAFVLAFSSHNFNQLFNLSNWIVSGTMVLAISTIGILINFISTYIYKISDKKINNSNSINIYKISDKKNNSNSIVNNTSLKIKPKFKKNHYTYFGSHAINNDAYGTSPLYDDLVDNIWHIPDPIEDIFPSDNFKSSFDDD